MSWKPRQGNIAEDVNVPEIVQETATEFAVKKMETGQYQDWKIGFLELAYTYEDLNGKTFSEEMEGLAHEE